MLSEERHAHSSCSKRIYYSLTSKCPWVLQIHRQRREDMSLHRSHLYVSHIHTQTIGPKLRGGRLYGVSAYCDNLACDQPHGTCKHPHLLMFLFILLHFKPLRGGKCEERVSRTGLHRNQVIHRALSYLQKQISHSHNTYMYLG